MFAWEESCIQAKQTLDFYGCCTIRRISTGFVLAGSGLILVSKRWVILKKRSSVFLLKIGILELKKLKAPKLLLLKSFNLVVIV